MKLRVWHVPQMPMDPFHVEVCSLDEAIRVIDLLANYDLFQFENKVKGDYCNMSGLEVFENDEWIEWESGDGESIDDIIHKSKKPSMALAVQIAETNLRLSEGRPAPATDEVSHAPNINGLRQRLQLAESIIDGLCNHRMADRDRVWKAAQEYREKYRG